jgi:hypothetical protein
MKSETELRTAKRALESVGRGDLRMSEASRLVLGAVDDRMLVPYVVAALKDVTWRLLVERCYGDDLVYWHEIFRRTETVLAGMDLHREAVEIASFTSLIARSFMFAEAQPFDVVASNVDTRRTLEELRDAGAAMTCEAIAEAVGPTIGTMMARLFILTAHGLLLRHEVDGEPIYEITTAGLAILV